MNPMTEVEHRIGLRPIEELLARRGELVEKVADLRARFGPFGTFEHLRKIELARIEGLIRIEAMRDKRKITNDQVKSEAHAHPDYIEMVIEATKQRARWVKLEARIEEIDMTINRGQAITRFLAAEAHL